MSCSLGRVDPLNLFEHEGGGGPVPGGLRPASLDNLKHPLRHGALHFSKVGSKRLLTFTGLDLFQDICVRSYAFS